MQDKLLFAAGLVALLIGLFVGVRSDNVRKTAEENLVNVSRQVDAVEQQLKTEEDRNKVIADKLGGMENKLDVAQDKLTIANDWYANLQTTNAALANDVYTIRLAMVEVLADLKEAPSAAGQASISQKIEKLVKMLDEHNAAARAVQPASKEAATAPGQEPAGKEKAKGAEDKAESGAGVTEKAPPAAAPEKGKDMSSGSGQQKKAASAEKTGKSEAGAPQITAPAEKGQNAAPAPKKEENRAGAVRL